MEVLDQDYNRNSNTAITSDEKMWSIIAHLSAIIHPFGGFFVFLCPLVIMLAFKDGSRVIYEQAKEALNFQISLILLQILAVICAITLLGIPVAICIWLFMSIGSWLFPIIAAIRLSGGERYQYPFTIRLL
ncbi:MAG: hypothetical protein RI894_1179 [Bacteroidota bacterium]|jgi:uncharacterized Tic20 family protein